MRHKTKRKTKAKHWRSRYRVSDEVWAKIEPLLPKHPPSPQGGRPRVPDRKAMDGIVFVLRTGCQWNALNDTGICSSSTAHARFQEWVRAGVFLQFWEQGLMEYEEWKGLRWDWQSMDGAMTKAPLGGKKNRAKSDGSGQKGRQAQLVV
jgi:transposase